MRINESTSTPVAEPSLDETPSAPPARSGGEPKPTGPLNQVERHPSAGTAPQPTPVATREGKPKQTKLSEEKWRELEAPLTRGWTDWAVTGQDVEAVQAGLKQLGPSEFREALGRMDRAGLLGRFVDNLSPSQREAFLGEAQTRGILRREEPLIISGPFDPPPAARPFFNDRLLPSALQRAIHEHCVEEHQRYQSSYAGYLGRYQAAVESAVSPPELRALGHPFSPHSRTPEPGVLADHPEYRAFSKDRLERTKSLLTANSAYLALQERMNTVLGRATAGSLNLIGDLTVKAKQGGVSDSVKLDFSKEPKLEFAHERTRKSGNVEVKDTVRIDSRGAERTREVGVESKLNTTRIAVGVTEKSVKVAVGPAEVELEKARLSMSFKTVAFATDEKQFVNAAGEVTTKVTVDPTAARLEATEKFTGKLNVGSVGLEVSGKVGFSYQGLTGEMAANAVSPHGVGIFTDPPELKAGVSWSALSDRRRANYEQAGWTPGEWRARLLAGR